MASDGDLPPRGAVTALVLAGGQGERLGGRPKAFLRHGGATLLEIAVDLLAARAGRVLVGLPAALLEEGRALVAGRPAADCLPGGASRQATLLALLGDARSSIVVLHEVARPFAGDALLRAVLAAVAAGHDAAVPVSPVTRRDSLVEVADGRVVGVPRRQALAFSTTPQAYRRAALVEVLARPDEEGRDEPTAFAALVRAGLSVAAVPGEAGNVKLTWPEDLALLAPDAAP